MKILLTEEEVKNIVATQSVEEIKLCSKGDYKKWDINKTDSDEYTLEYIYDEKGNLKDKFKDAKSVEDGE